MKRSRKSFGKRCGAKARARRLHLHKQDPARFSQVAVAKAVGMTPSELNHFERERMVDGPGGETLAKLVAVLRFPDLLSA